MNLKQDLIMNRIFKLSVMISFFLFLSIPVMAEDSFELVPITQDDYQAKSTFSLLAGSGSANSASGSVVGLEYSLTCPLLKLSRGSIRQQISYTTGDMGTVTLSSFELNPHYLIELSDSLALGFGPGFGYLSSKSDIETKSMLAFQLGGSLHYRVGSWFLGGEARQQFAADSDWNNMRLAAKGGIDF